jgi:hypothetical protein
MRITIAELDENECRGRAFPQQFMILQIRFIGNALPNTSQRRDKRSFKAKRVEHLQIKKIW